MARQQSVSERRQGATRTSSGVHHVFGRLEAPGASLPCARPPAFETAAQVMHTMLVKISQNSLFQPSLCASPLGIAKGGRSLNLPVAGHTKHKALRQRQFVRGGNRLEAHKKNTTCGISKNISAGFERSVGSRKAPEKRAVLLIVVLRPVSRGIVGLNPLCLSLRPYF